MESSSDEVTSNLTPPDVLHEAQIASDSLLPTKSMPKYVNTYETFLQWKVNKNAKSFSENVLMAYFNEMSSKYKPSSLWSIYSMLKSTIKAKNNIDISHYGKVTAFLKRKSDGFKSKKSKVLSASDVRRFISEAPDNKYLATKVALIFGITGACRKQELANITVGNVKQQGQILIVKIPDTKTKIPRTFVIEGEFYEIVRKYEAHRPAKCKSNRFFQNFQNGKYSNQNIGINKFGAMPKQIAAYLGLPEPESYTGHSFRRTSATLLADSGASLTTLKRHGGWKSNTVAESYIEDSVENKRTISASISRSVDLKIQNELQPSTSYENVHTHPIPAKPQSSTSKQSYSTFTEPQPTSSKQPDMIYTDPQPSNSYEHVHTHAIPAEPQSSRETYKENENPSDITNTNLSQTIQLAGKTITFNLQNCTNINFNFNK